MSSYLYFVSHPYKGDIKKNLKKCTKICNNLLDMDYIIFSSIIHSHQLDIVKRRTPEFWYYQDIEILKKCDGIILCGDWEESFGCGIEKMFAESIGLEILYYEDIREAGVSR